MAYETENQEGSSPLARGALVAFSRVKDCGGIIPACAGSTVPWVCVRVPSRDHPRLRGEHCRRTGSRPRTRGSSPLARGALLLLPYRVAVHGIIPACAGSTSPRTLLPSGRRDHPRLRGEHMSQQSVLAMQMGSSPLARGAHKGRYRYDPRLRIIPACAGSTVGDAVVVEANGDHPRLRGEHPRPEVLERLGLGIIPACAGSTASAQT